MLGTCGGAQETGVIDRKFREVCSEEPRLVAGPFVPAPALEPRESFEADLRAIARSGAGIIAVTAPETRSGSGSAVGDLDGCASALDACRRACTDTGALVAAALAPLDAAGSPCFSRAYIHYHARVKGLAASDPDLFWITGSRDLIDLHAAAVAVRELWRGPIVACVPGPNDPSQPNPRWAAGAVILAGLGIDVVGLTGETGAEDRALLARIAGLPAATATPRGAPLSETFRLAADAASQGAGILSTGPDILPEVIPVLSALLGRARPGCADPEPGPWLATPAWACALSEGGATLTVAIGEGHLRDRASIHDLLASGTEQPLEIEAAHADLLETALRSYPGRPLVRIVARDRTEQEECVYMCARYGAVGKAVLRGADPNAAIAEATDWLAWADTYRLADLRFEPDRPEMPGAVPRVRAHP